MTWTDRSGLAFNLPLDLAARLLDRPLTGRRAHAERKSRATWSAFTGYLAIDRVAVPDETPLFHQVLQSYDRPLHQDSARGPSPSGDGGIAVPRMMIKMNVTRNRR